MTLERSTSGHGFTIRVWHGFDQETSFGVGPSGFPICPDDGHGEMVAWDEELSSVSASEAITAVAQRVNGNGSQPKLFDTTKPFNFEGAWMDIERQQTVVDDLSARHEEDAERAKGSKKLLDSARETLGRMVHMYRDRRVAKAKQLADEQERAAAETEKAEAEKGEERVELPAIASQASADAAGATA